MAEKIKWGIIGLGKIAHTFAEDLLRSPATELTAVASRSAKKAESFAAKYGAPHHFSSYEQFIESAEVDVVYIATPHAFHVALSRECLLKGKAVLCEKPMGMNAKEVRSITELAKEKKLFLMEGIWTRFMPSFIKMQALLAEGVLGKIKHLEADFGFAAKYNEQGRLFNKKLGGGSLLDIGIYPLFLSLHVLGKPSKIKAEAEICATGVDSSCRMELYYEKGATAKLYSSFMKTTPTEAIIFGENGNLKLHTRFHHSPKLTLNLNNGEATIFELPYLGNGYVHEISEVNKCLRNGVTQSELLPLKFSLQLTELLDSVREKIGLVY